MKLYTNGSEFFTVSDEQAAHFPRYALTEIRAFQRFVKPPGAETLTVIACAWCEDKAQAGEFARRRGYPVSHTCCPSCAAQMARTRPAIPQVAP